MDEMPHQESLRRRLRHYVTAIPVTFALMCLAIYGCRELDAPFPVAAVCVGLPGLMLVLYVIGIVTGLRRLDDREDDAAE